MKLSSATLYIISQTSSSDEPRFTYTGREWDADSELLFYRARWYDPQVGRFISEDPLGFGGLDANLSRYLGNGSVNFTDASGLQRAANQPFTAPPLILADRPDIQAMLAAIHVDGAYMYQGDWLDISANYAAGIGDSLTFSGTYYLREWWDINDGIDRTSTAYIAGETTEFAAELAITGGGAASHAMQERHWRDGLEIFRLAAVVIT